MLSFTLKSGVAKVGLKVFFPDTSPFSRDRLLRKDI